MNQVVENVEFSGLNLVELSEGIETADLGHEYEEEALTAEEFAEFLKYNREVLGYKQCDMADALGVNKNSYNAFERAKRMPKSWEALVEQVRIMVKAKQRSIRNGEDFKSSLTSDLKKEILGMHGRGLNIVQISVRVGVEETIIRQYLNSKGLTPVIYHPSWLSNTAMVDEYADFDGEIDEDIDEDGVVA